ncbi:MAG TPA: non-ribosomal peptide synthetase, partial [Ktedonobacter sp.]|nr:non-ribosomal peptide synthetase [Ktedonobacter sp.]
MNGNICMLYTTRFSEDTRIETSVYDYSAQGEAQLPHLTDTERAQILVEWNATTMPYSENVSLPQLIEEQVARTPDAVALMYENTQFTYRELNARANQLACYLRQLGVGPEVLVGVCIERSLELVVALLGILKAGGAYVPLDPAYPAERIAFMLSDAQVPVLITQQHLLERLPAHQAHVVCMDTDASLLAQQNDANLMHITSAGNVAYVIYTSGSTGRPKGVQVLQGSLVNLLLSMRHQPGLTAEDRLLAITTFSFDIAALELFLPLIVGASVIIASQDVVKNGAALLDVLNRSDVTVMQATPVTWQMLLAAGWQGSSRLKVLTGGEALSLSLARQLLARAASVWNLYGPTETTIYSSGCRIEQTDTVIPIGRPIANTTMYILDEHLQPVPIGVAGELYIGGDGLARGYLHRPELTSEKFIQHPFERDAHARLYKTGDLARYLPDGRIQCLGRIDSQVKIRGFRIELGEIEAQLVFHLQVRQCVVVARDNGAGDKQLVAYVVLREKQDTTDNTTGTELRELVQKALPDYMMPSAFVELDALPQTPNGKVDRLALPAPETARQLVDKPFVAPTTLGQLQLQHIWEELLDVRPIGVHDNFFHIGGHSLLAAKLVERIEQESGKRISLATLFAAPTIEQLVLAMQTEEEKSSRIPLVPVQAAGSKSPFFYLHGAWDSDAFYCFQLSKRLGPDQPFYALPPYDFTGLQVAPSIEEMATAHIQAIRAVQPQGPYLLGGFCNGGLIAYEMARQLVMQGEEIERLVLV